MKYSVGAPAHATSADRALSTLNLEITGFEWTASLSGRFTTGKEHIPIEEAAGWVSKPVRTL